MKTESAETAKAAALEPAALSPATRAWARSWDWLARLLLVALFALVCFRAATQAIAHDEALAFQMFLSGGIGDVLRFNTVNHVLFTLLAKFCVVAFGLRELSFRLPTLAGAALYFASVYFLCRRLFPGALLRFLGVALLCLNPAVLDFMSAARGYGLGLACLVAATLAMVMAFDRGALDLDPPSRKFEWRWECVAASIFLALAVTANVTNIVGAAALALMFVLIVLLGGLPGGSAESRRSGQIPVAFLAEYFIVPGAAVFLFLMWPYLIQIRAGTFGIGFPAASWMLRDIFNTSFLYKWTGDIYSPALAAVPPATGSWQQAISDAGVRVFFPLLLVAAVAGLVWFSRPGTAASPARRLTESRTVRAAGQLLCGAAVLSVAAIFGAHILLHVNYQYSRTSLYLIPFFTLATLLTAQGIILHLHSPALRGACKALGLVLIAAVLCDYALALNTRYFRYNAYDAISRAAFQSILADAQSRGLTAAPGSVRVGGTWWYEPEMNFYRRRYKAGWLSVYDVKSPGYEFQAQNSLTPADYDYFLCTPLDLLCASGDAALFAGAPHRALFFDPATRLTVYAVGLRQPHE